MAAQRRKEELEQIRRARQHQHDLDMRELGFHHSLSEEDREMIRREVTAGDRVGVLITEDGEVRTGRGDELEELHKEWYAGGVSGQQVTELSPAEKAWLSRSTRYDIIHTRLPDKPAPSF